VFEQRLLIARQWSDPKRKLTIRSRSLPAARAELIPVRMPFEHMTNMRRLQVKHGKTVRPSVGYGGADRVGSVGWTS
jgi:hypothetical protein